MSRTVDVIVPSYNYAGYLRACLQSLLAQERVAVRVLVIDDCSSDDTPALGSALARDDARVTFRRHARNHGHIATYNEGFQWATADYVLLISADDLLVPGALARAVDALESHPEAAFAYGRQVPFTGDPVLPASAPSPRRAAAVVQGDDFIRRVCASGENPVATPTVVVRTRLQHQAGGYTAALPHTADLEMWLRLAALGSVINVNTYQAFKREHASNMQHAYRHRVAGDVMERSEAFFAFLERPDCVLPDREELRRTATAALAMSVFWRGSQFFDARAVDEAVTLFDLAVSLDPAVRRRPEWRRMQIKLRLGAGLWSKVSQARTTVSRRFGRNSGPIPGAAAASVATGGRPGE